MKEDATRVEPLGGAEASPTAATASGDEEMAAKWAAEIAAAGAATESEMRDAAVPWFKSGDELTQYIKALVDRPHDYGTCAYAMSMAATAAFQYVAGVLGTTGFQASCADMDVLRRTRLLKGPFMFVKVEDALYPQYDLVGRVSEFIAEQSGWLADEAAKKLAASEGHAHPNVIAHWQRLAAAREAK